MPCTFWLQATAVVAVLVGSLADWLAARGWSTLSVRRTMQVLAVGGTGVR